MSELKVSLLNRRLFCGIILIFVAVLAVAHPYRAFLNESGGSVEGPAWMAVFTYGVSSERTRLFLPLFVPLGAAGDVQEELKSRYAVFLVSRAGKKNYLAGKILGAVLTRNHYLGYAVPFILYYVLTVFQERYYDKYYILSPRQWAYPSYFGAGVCVGILIFLIAAAGLLLMKLTERRLTG